MKAQFKACKQKLRNIRISIAKKLLDREPPASNCAISQAKSVLFLRQDGKIGDFIVSSFVFHEIKRQRPEVKIGVVCAAEQAHLFANNPDIDQLYTSAKRGLWADYQIGKKLQNQYDVVVEPTLVFRVRDLVLLRTIAAPHNIGYQKSDYRLFNHNLQDSDLHYTDIYCKILNLIGINYVNTQYRLPENPKADARVAKWLAEQNIEDYIALNFFGAAQSRRFHFDNIEKILSSLTKSYPQQTFVCLGFPEVNEKLAEIVKPFSGCHVFEKTKNIFENIALIRHAKAVVSPDTALVHVAVALDKPLIALYSDDERNFANWFPYDPKAKVLRYSKNINEINMDNLVKQIQTLL